MKIIGFLYPQAGRKSIVMGTLKKRWTKLAQESFLETIMGKSWQEQVWFLLPIRHL
ncbi:hypothetical protein DITRI_Ditri16bG0052000 [Diplodiscus trichospermus]